MRYRTVLIDLDGTLIDHLPAIHRSYGHTLPQLGLPAPSLEQVKRAIGGGVERTMRSFVSEDQLPNALRIYRDHWDQTMLEGASLMRGCRELLEDLQDREIQAAVFTNKHGPSARLVCEHLGVSHLLAGVYGAADTPWLKPQPEFAAHVLSELQAEATTTCLIGDSPYDVAAALAAGLDFVGVQTGTHSEHELRAAGATVIVEDMEGVRRLWGYA